MKPHRNLVFTSLLLCAMRTPLIAGGNLIWRAFNDGLDEARKANKKSVIDVYTDWCGWCKKMDNSTYADKDVTTYLRQRYVLIKLNAESDKKLYYKNKEYTERDLAESFGISGYPSTLFLTSAGEPITIYPGFATAMKFKQVLSFIADDYYLTKKFEEFMAGSK